MEERATAVPGGVIRGTTPRAVFAELVAGALDAIDRQPSPMAVAYLVELLDQRVRRPESAARLSEEGGTLAEELLAARLEQGTARLRWLRQVGDRALFVSGFFGDSLDRRAVDIDYYSEAGSAAYADVASGLAARLRVGAWSRLFGELANRFRDLVEVLAVVSDRTQPTREVGLLRLYERYLRTGSERDHRRLLRRGCVPLDPRVLQFWQ